ncbi:aldehyde ferredoxin oxidoreductase family protein [Deferrisoma camini]|uniref:aldehyde ferredoxin oxidoreductase family protein n=1 Tax=Deferrisoma camini TaxID=1035120 RepID=UPI00046D9699|nr:aldehyde ferredoxin oxidoreductase family protein [Deferrisoma camini]
MNGFYGRVLVADATQRTCRIEEVPEEVARGMWGGKGLGVWLLERYGLVGVDPLAPENPLVLLAGPVAGTPIPGSCRHALVTKSPQTGFFSESYSGGKLAEKIAKAGVDAVVLLGRADDPVVLEVGDGQGRFHDASDLWGQDTFVAEAALVERFGGSGRVGACVIGPAGENGVVLSIVANDKWRCAGRTGAGAVMGSKRVKGVVFHGSASRPLADPDGVRAFARRTVAERRGSPAAQTYRNYGTPNMVALLNTVGAFPNRYWHRGRSGRVDEISAEALLTRCEVKPKACARCFMACGKLTRVTSGPYEGLVIEGPEYETIYAFGGLCEIAPIEAVAHLNDVCDRLGLDTISAGNLVAFAMEASERGAVDETVAFGDVEAAERLLGQIARREGLGEVLARGIVAAARQWGLEGAAIHVKGLEPAGYDPRVLPGMGLAYATSDRGACHLRTTFYKAELSGQIPPEQVEGKAALLMDYEDRLALMDALILCRFYRDFYGWEELAEIARLTLGVEGGRDELRATARRIADAVRRFNMNEGLTADDDRLPPRFFDEPLPETGAVLRRDDFERMRREYYALRGWDPAGRPGPGND